MPSSFDMYRVTGTAGNVGTPGAPILEFDLLVNSSTGNVSGHAQITQVVAPPGVRIDINNVTGKVRTLVFGGTVTLAVTLKGTYGQPGPPPTDFIILEHFLAQFSTNEQWDGRGSFDYGTHVVNDVPVTCEKSSGGIHTLYGAVMHGAVATGDVVRMKEVAAKAEQYISQTAEIRAALTHLNAEIAKATQ
jgi:hypothetical protein